MLVSCPRPDPLPILANPSQRDDLLVKLSAEVLDEMERIVVIKCKQDMFVVHFSACGKENNGRAKILQPDFHRSSLVSYAYAAMCNSGDVNNSCWSSPARGIFGGWSAVKFYFLTDLVLHRFPRSSCTSGESALDAELCGGLRYGLQSELS